MVTSTLREKSRVQVLFEQLEKRILTFLDAVEESDDLTIVGTSNPQKKMEVFVIRNLSVSEGVEGAFVEVSINEIVSKVTDANKAQEFIRVIQSDRPSIVLEGVTRIVGYYSRTHNWNKSKVGELRDRANGDYGLLGKSPLFQNGRLKAIDSL